MRAAGLLVPVAAAAAGAAALVALPAEWLAAAEARVGTWSAWLGGVRVAAIAAAWLWWDALVERVPGLDSEGAAYLKARRAFWIGTLAAVELVVVRNAPGALWALLVTGFPGGGPRGRAPSSRPSARPAAQGPGTGNSGWGSPATSSS